MPSKSTIPITIRVSKDVLTAIDEQASLNEVTRSLMSLRLIRRGLHGLLAEEEETE